MKNKGFTLVELVVVMAIMGLLGLAVVNFIGTSSNQYKSATKEVDLQYEAQLTMNQIGDLLIDAQKGVKYESGSVANPVEVASVNEENSITSQAASSDSKLIIYNSDCIYNIIYRPADSKIYLRKDTVDESTGNVTEEQESLMAEHVVGFTPDLSEAQSKNSVKIVVDFKNGDKTYTSTQNFTMRNKVPVGKDVDYVPEPEEPEPEEKISLRIYYNGVDCTRSSVNILDETGHLKNPIHLTAKVFGGENPDQNVIWSLDSTTITSYTTIDGSGNVYPAWNENSNSIKVIATSIQDPSVSEYTYLSTGEWLLQTDTNNTMDFNTLHVWFRDNVAYTVDDFEWKFRVDLVDDYGNVIGPVNTDGFVVNDPYMPNNDGAVIYYDYDRGGKKTIYVKTGKGLGSNKYNIYIWGVSKSDPTFVTNEILLRKTRG